MKRPILLLALLALLTCSAAVVVASLAAPDVAIIAARYAERPRDVTAVIAAGRETEATTERGTVVWWALCIGASVPLAVVAIVMLQMRGAELVRQVRLARRRPSPRRQLAAYRDETQGS